VCNLALLAFQSHQTHEEMCGDVLLIAGQSLFAGLASGGEIAAIERRKAISQGEFSHSH
jgi:hypothetical protein